MLFHVTRETFRKIKALLLLAILSVSEGRRLSSNILAGSYSASGTSARNAESRVHGRYEDGPKHTKLQQPAGLVQDHLKALMEDPGLLEESKLLVEQIKGLAAEPKVQEWHKFVTEATEHLTKNRYLQERAKLASEQLSAIIDDTKLWQQSRVFVEQLGAMMTDTSVKDQDHQERAKVVSEQLNAIMKTLGLQKHSTLVAEHIRSIVEDPEVQEWAKLASEKLKMIAEDQDVAERVKLASEQAKAILEHPVLQDKSQLFVQQMAAMITNSEVKEWAVAIAEQLDAIMKHPARQKYSEAINAHSPFQKTNGGLTMDLSSLAEVYRSSSGISFVPPSFRPGRSPAVASHTTASQAPLSHIRASDPWPAVKAPGLMPFDTLNELAGRSLLASPKLRRASVSMLSSEKPKLSVPWLLDPNTKGGILVWTIIAIVLPFFAYSYMIDNLGWDVILAGNVILVGYVGLATVLWTASYVFRVANKDMTYAQQLRDYENAVIQKRFEELSTEEVDALMGEVYTTPKPKDESKATE